MKHTEITDHYIELLDEIMNEIKPFYIKDYNIYIFLDAEHYLTSLNIKAQQLRSINFKDIKREFWETCSELDKISPLKRVFEVKFESFLNWRTELSKILTEFGYTISGEISYFINNQRNKGQFISEEQEQKIGGMYFQISLELSWLKIKLKHLFDQWDKMATPSYTIDEQIALPISSKFKLANKKKTDFIKILSAMYDNRMFEAEDGYLASNKQELMNEFGSILGEDLSNYSVLLSKSKEPEKDVFLKPFDAIRNKAEEYYNKELNK